MPEPSRVFVLWSGGVDSTYLVEKCLADPAYDLVMAGYVWVKNNETKSEAELDAIWKMLPHLRKNPRFEYAGLIMEVQFTKTNTNLSFKQIPIWLLAAIEAIHFPVTDIAVGYVKNTEGSPDDAAAWVREIETIYRAYQPLMHRPLPRLVFPLLGESKADVLARVSPELRALCVYCEYPIKTEAGFVRCGKCRICMKRRADFPDIG